MNSSLTRRQLLAAGATAGAAFALFATFGIPASWAQPAGGAAGGADAFVKSFIDELLVIVNGAQGNAAKHAALGPVIDRYVDVDTVARFCLGRFWASASPDQRTKYVTLFHQVLLNQISGHLGEYKGVSYTIEGTHSQGGEILVDTIITRPNAPTANVQWVISTSTGSPKVIDLLAEGTSLRLTQRQDYASYLVRHGNNIDQLIAALGRQLNGG